MIRLFLLCATRDLSNPGHSLPQKRPAAVCQRRIPGLGWPYLICSLRSVPDLGLVNGTHSPQKKNPLFPADMRKLCDNVCSCTSAPALRPTQLHAPQVQTPFLHFWRTVHGHHTMNDLRAFTLTKSLMLRTSLTAEGRFVGSRCKHPSKRLFAGHSLQGAACLGPSSHGYKSFP
jgi:hypothetical protein